MTCPFLQEAQVKYCRTSSLRKLIPLAQSGRAADKCVSPAFTTCAAFRARPADTNGCTCPHLDESLMQYCAAAPVAKFVPYSESVISRCGNGGFRYCDLYLGMAHPRPAADDPDVTPLPDWLRYSANHLWLDATDDGTCHIGIDAFLGRALGQVERVTYVWLKGLHRPAAVFTLGGVDFEVVFPNPVLLTNCNLYARAEPSRITAQPYTGGWLFEGRVQPGTSEGLLDGATARPWMENEQRRMNDVLQRQQQTAGDGGLPRAGILARLNREQRLELFHEFFSPFKGDT